MERKEFIQNACAGCFALAGISILGPLLQGCSPSSMIYKATGNEQALTVPVSALSGKNYLVVRNNQLDNDLLLVKDSDSQFHALLMKCTHEDQPLIFAGNQLVCNTHGSRFDTNGNVLADPAILPLHKLRTEIKDANILIYFKNA